MNPNVPMFLHARENARACGDANLVRSITADLDRLGYVDRVVTPSGFETAAVRAPETATPKHKGGRPALPRCDHGKTPGNCRRCPDHK